MANEWNSSMKSCTAKSTPSQGDDVGKDDGSRTTMNQDTKNSPSSTIKKAGKNVLEGPNAFQSPCLLTPDPAQKKRNWLKELTEDEKRELFSFGFLPTPASKKIHLTTAEAKQQEAKMKAYYQRMKEINRRRKNAPPSTPLDQMDPIERAALLSDSRKIIARGPCTPQSPDDATAPGPTGLVVHTGAQPWVSPMAGKLSYYITQEEFSANQKHHGNNK